MTRGTAAIFLAAALAAAAVAVTRWPRLSQVETGRTPEYAELKDREYPASEEAVAKAVRESMEGLGWRVVGGGRGPGGSQVQAVAAPLPGLEFEVTARVQGGRRARVHVLSRSARGFWDFGENARLITRLHSELDRRLASR
jgi:hypothetical protein